MSDLNGIVQFEVAPGDCSSPVHHPGEPRRALCVRIGGLEVCGDCIEQYSFDFDEAVGEWRRKEGRSDG